MYYGSKLYKGRFITSVPHDSTPFFCIVKTLIANYPQNNTLAQIKSWDVDTGNKMQKYRYTRTVSVYECLFITIHRNGNRLPLSKSYTDEGAIR